MTPAITSRLQRLHRNLVELRAQIRSAVASELGSVVGDAIRDLVRLAVEPPARSVPAKPKFPARRSTSWDEPDEWEDEPYSTPRGRAFPEADDQVGVDSAPLARPSASPWPRVLSTGVAATQWAIARKIPAWAGIGLGVMAGFATWYGGPLLAVGLVAADLLAFSSPVF